MDLGVHLPLLTWDEAGSGRVSLIEYVRTAEPLGLAVSVNDQVQFHGKDPRPSRTRSPR